MFESLFNFYYSYQMTISIIICIIIFISYKLTFWKRQKIPNKITHILSLFSYPIHLADQKLIEKYGKIVGFVQSLRLFFKPNLNLIFIFRTYELLSPTILVADPNLIKRIFNSNIKDFFNHRVRIIFEG